MRVLLIDSPSALIWSDEGHRLRYIAEGCRHRFDVREVLAFPQAGKEPILASCGHEADAAPLTEAATIVDLVKGNPPDLCIAPLRGGIAHGLLMARACGEVPQSMRIALVAEEPTRSKLLRHGDVGECPVRPLIADAMERFCLETADALLVAPSVDLAPLRALDLENLPALSYCIDAAPSRDILLRTEVGPREFCFIGPFCRSSNVVTFIEAVEAIASSDPDKVQRVVFIGPMSDATHAPGKEWLGRRALGWPFGFRTIETNRFTDALDYIRQSKCVAYVPDTSTSSWDRLRNVGMPSFFLDSDTSSNPDRLRSAIEQASVTAADVGSHMSVDSPPHAKLDVLCAALQAIEERNPLNTTSSNWQSCTLSICVLHKDRPVFLREALDSVFAQLPSQEEQSVELVLFDNGSTQPDSIKLLDELALDSRIRLIRNSATLPNPTAMNAMASHVSSEFMAFLDDDNLLAEGGIAALSRACSTNSFDVIASNLWLFDTDRPAPARAAKLAFVGPARSSGLFFNFFGDTCMAFRRSAFQRIGGFHDAKAASPGPDWVLLARAQAAGAAIGVLQEPAFFYRRSLQNADLNWQKYDQHGLRHIVLSHYGKKYDPDLVTKIAQHLLVRYYQ